MSFSAGGSSINQPHVPMYENLCSLSMNAQRKLNYRNHIDEISDGNVISMALHPIHVIYREA